MSMQNAPGGVAETSIAAATAAVGYDLLKDTIYQQSSSPRVITQAGLAGSAAALDTRVDLFVGNVQVGTLYNVATGAVLTDAHLRKVGAFVPGGTEVKAIVADAPATNAINLVVEFA